MHMIRFMAEFRCDAAHHFTAYVDPQSRGAQARCPQCLEAFLAAHVANGHQVSEPVADNYIIVTVL